MSAMTRSILAGTMVLTLGTGCGRQVNNPFADSGAWGREELTTPSAEGYREAHVPVAQLQRCWPKSLIYGRNGYVTHWPVWWEDPFVDKGNGPTDPNNRDRPDQCFAVNWADYLAIACSPARFALNTIAWPVSAIVTPPGTVMLSDGRLSRQRLGYDHDAVRAYPGAEPPHVTPLNMATEVVSDDDAPPPLPLPPVVPFTPPPRGSATQRR